MGRLVWFGVISLSPAGAVAALAGLAISIGATAYVVGRAHGRVEKTPEPELPFGADPLDGFGQALAHLSAPDPLATAVAG